MNIRPKSKAPIRPAEDACVALMKLVERYSYEGKLIGPLTHATFWAGAGFSKAWEPTAPVGEQLFTLDEKFLGDIALSSTLYDICGVEPLHSISHRQLRQIVYQLDMFERYPDLHSRYLDDQNIHIFRAALCNAVWKTFERTPALLCQ
jgi:hypothetical protein